MSRAEESGMILTEEDASVVKGMLLRGDRQHDIAAWFGVNGGRIAEISTGKKFFNVAAQDKKLPPVGPYLSGRQSEKTRRELLLIRKKAEELVAAIDQILGDL